MSQLNAECSPYLLSQVDVSARLKISQRQLQRMIAAGDFPPPMKVGAQNRWNEAHLNEYISRLAELASVGTQNAIA